MTKTQITNDEGWSEIDSATTRGDVPAAPPLMANPSGDENLDTDTSITIGWTAPTLSASGAMLTDVTAITGYEVHKWNGSSWVLLATKAASATTHTDTGIVTGSIHYYIVRALNSNGSGKWSGFVSDTTAITDPDAPTLTATTRGTNSIQLTWTAAVLNGTDRLRRSGRWLRAPDMGWRLV